MVDPPRSQRLVVVGMVAGAVAGTLALHRRRRVARAAAHDDPREEEALLASQRGRSANDVIEVTLPPIPGAPDRSWRTAPAGGVAILDRGMDDHASAEVAQVESYGDGPRVRPPITADMVSDRLGPAVVPPSRHRLSGASLAAIAAAVGLAAIGTGGWAFIQSVRDQETQPAAFVENPSVAQRAVSLTSKPSTERIPLRNAVGRIVLVVGAKGFGMLVLDGLGPAPNGRTYQAWVTRPGADAPVSAALFSGHETAVQLTTLVPHGATVAVTLEGAGGATAPTRTPKLQATRS